MRQRVNLFKPGKLEIGTSKKHSKHAIRFLAGLRLDLANIINDLTKSMLNTYVGVICSLSIRGNHQIHHVSKYEKKELIFA